MKSLITVLLLTITGHFVYAQKTSPQLRADTPVSKTEVIHQTYPRITLNDNKCRFSSMAILPDADGAYAIRVDFARPCDREEQISIVFNSLEEAVLVKDLVMKNRDYDFFHLFKDREGQTSFEILYPAK